MGLRALSSAAHAINSWAAGYPFEPSTEQQPDSLKGM